ncbi:hypothetical protein SJAV_20110 [Sulfurisphaera javensis]|uniref:Uncharacterized protein n=1 Tax=Sulfurisphaera javensis TaxID=2049879 RepID=A0AAT9GTD0_9CREN
MKTPILIGIIVAVVVAITVPSVMYFILIHGNQNNPNVVASSNSNTTVLLQEIASLKAQISNLTSENQALQSEVNNLQSIVNLQNTRTIANDYTVNQPAGQYSTISFTANYAGYVTVNVLSSTTTKTTVTIVEYTNMGQTITSQTYNVGTSGTVVFPVLPGEIEVEVGNSNFFNGATETVTVTYTY